MARCTELSPINGWRCSRIEHVGRLPGPHRARDPKAAPIEVTGCLTVGGATGGSAVEEWED
jgi:hypothetical protein